MRDNTLEAFVDRRQKNRRGTQVHVVCDAAADPPEGRELAEKVAHILRKGEGTIIEPTEGVPDVSDVVPWSVLFISVEHPESIRQMGSWREIEKLLNYRRAKTFQTLIHASAISNRAKNVCDVRVYSDTEEAVRLHRDPFEGEVYEEPFDGITAEDIG